MNQQDIRKTSKNNHCISAAGQNTTGTYLVYVGNLAIETSEFEISKHLSSLDIMSDVIRLNGKSPTKQTSFCVSVSDGSDMNKVFPCDLMAFRCSRSPNFILPTDREVVKDFANTNKTIYF